LAYQNRIKLPVKIQVFSDFLVNHIGQNTDAGIWVDTKKQAELTMIATMQR
jgi:hypothetical protein